jgi:hypothetical protein
MFNNRAADFMKQNLVEFKEEIDNTAVIVGDYSTSFLVRINKNIELQI